MKRIFTLLALMITGVHLIGQSLILSDANGALAPDAIVTFTADISKPDIVAPLDVMNAGSDTIQVLCKKVEITLVPGSVNMFCWTQCYGPGTYVSPEPLQFDPGHIDCHSFYGEYYHNGNLGTSRVAYIFYDQNNPDDSVRVFIDYVVQAAGLAELFALGKYSLSLPFPNPTRAETRIAFRLPQGSESVLKVFNLLGNEMATYRMLDTDGEIRLDVSDWVEGLYFYSLWVDNEFITTLKLIVKQ